ncbi:MAG TPA: DUF2267 domain-containing protein [Acidimicrobiales bacterium]|nr:DUF2267 domain-containing protein [Acidimicrobiales bacterium]
MDYDALIKRIQAAGEFPDRDHARVAAEAVLSVLGERLAGHEPADFAAQLPPELAMALPLEGGRQTFGVEEFDRRVAEREGRGCSLARAHAHAIAVMQSVLEAVTPGERDDVAAQLPAELVDLKP